MSGVGGISYHKSIKIIDTVKMKYAKEPKTITEQLDQLRSRGLEFTFEENAIHKIAASFCFGREKSIPIMFQSILDKIGIKENDAPKFHYYIKRHIEIDGEEHGPMSENLLSTICKDNTTSWTEALETAISALKARDHFWSEIESEMS